MVKKLEMPLDIAPLCIAYLKHNVSQFLFRLILVSYPLQNRYSNKINKKYKI